MSVAALVLTTNCSKQEVVFDEQEQLVEITESPSTFSLVATSKEETKTVNDGLSTDWASTDHLNIVHADVLTPTTYVDDGQFDTSDSDKASGRFTGTLGSSLESGHSYNWYSIYPYKNTIESPVNTTVSYYIGKRSDQAQEQDGKDSKAHLAGSNFPMFGKATDVAESTTPTIAMDHLASVLEIQVTNKSTVAINVEDIAFTAPSGTAIVGQFIINFSASPISYADGTYTSETANLSVKGDASLAVDATASFFIGIKPFTATSGDQLKLSVNGYQKTLNLTKTVTFEAGKIKRLTFQYDKAPDVYELVSSIGAISDEGKYVFALQDGVTTSTYYFLNNAGTADNLDKGLTVSTNTITNPSKKYVFTAEAASTLFKFVNSEGNYIHNGGSNTTLDTNNETSASWYVSVVDGGYFKFNLANSTGRFIAASAATPSKVAAYANSNWSNSNANQHASPANAIAQYSGAWSVFKLGGYVVPTGISDETVNDQAARGASGLTKTVTLTGYDSAPTLTATPDGTIVTAASVTATTTTSATITYTLANNYTQATRAGSITVSDTDSHSGTITVNQVADVFTSTAANPLVIGNTSGATKSCTVKSDFDWTISTTNLTGATVSPTSFTYSSSQNQSITFTTTAANLTASPVDLGYITVTRTADGSTFNINVQQEAIEGDPTETFTFSTIYSTVTDGSQSVDGTSINIGGDATVLFEKNSGTTGPSYYASGSRVRTYAKNKLTVSVSGSKKITKIIFEVGGTTSAGVTANTGTLGAISSGKRTWTADTDVSSVEFTNGTSGQMHYSVIKIYYE